MTPEQEALIRERLAKITRADWVAAAQIDDDEWNTAAGKSPDTGETVYSGVPCPDVDTEAQAQKDCAFAAHAPADIDLLLSTIDALRDECAAKDEALRAVHKHCRDYGKQTAIDALRGCERALSPDCGKAWRDSVRSEAKEECAKLAAAHRPKEVKITHDRSDDFRVEVDAEMRGERIAAQEIAAAIRQQKEGA